MLKSSFTYPAGFSPPIAAILSFIFLILALLMMAALESLDAGAFLVALLGQCLVTFWLYTLLKRSETLHLVFNDCDQCSIEGGNYGVIHPNSRISPWWVWLVVEIPNIGLKSLVLCTWKFDTNTARSLNFRILRALADG